MGPPWATLSHPGAHRLNVEAQLSTQSQLSLISVSTLNSASTQSQPSLNSVSTQSQHSTLDSTQSQLSLDSVSTQSHLSSTQSQHSILDSTLRPELVFRLNNCIFHYFLWVFEHVCVLNTEVVVIYVFSTQRSSLGYVFSTQRS